VTLTGLVATPSGLVVADPAAALVIVVFLVREGLEALRGEEHEDRTSQDA